MTIDEFMNNCTACGGSWSAMLMSGIKKCFPDFYERLEDRSYSYIEVINMLVELGVTGI